MAVTLAGNVSDYTETVLDGMAENIAEEAGVPPSAVTYSVESAGRRLQEGAWLGGSALEKARGLWSS